MKNNYLNISFQIIYLLFFLFFIYNVFVNNILSSCVALILLLFFTFIYKKYKISTKGLMIILILSILSRFLFLLFDQTVTGPDYTTFLANIKNFADGIPVNKEYISLFPHLAPYIIFMGTVLKITMVKFKIIVLLQIILDIIAGLVVYKTFKGNKGLLGCIFIIINPINVMWSSLFYPSTLTNFFLIISLCVFYKMDQESNRKNKLLLAIILGLCLSIANLYRPIMIILLIALFIILFLTNFDYKNIKQSFVIYLLIIVTFFSTSSIFRSVNQYILKLNFSSNSIGWNLYLGSNTKYNGYWNKEDAKIYEKIMNENGNPSRFHSKMKDLAIERYKSNGIKNLKLFYNKFEILTSHMGSYSASEYISNNNMNFNYYSKLEFICSVFYTLLIFISFIYIKKDDRISNFIKLSVIGIVLASLLLEVSPRYTLQVNALLLFLFAHNFNYQKEIN